MKQYLRFSALFLVVIPLISATPTDILNHIVNSSGKTKLIWKTEIPGIAAFARIVFVDEKIIVNNGKGVISALIPGRGKLLWSYDCQARITGSVSGEAKVVYAATAGGKLVAVNTSNGKEKWTYQAGSAFGCTPLITGNYVFVYSKNEFICLDKETGLDMWRTDLSVDGSPLMTWFDGNIYLADYSFVYSISGTDGTVNWKFAVPAYGSSAIAASIENIAFVNNNNLIMINRNSGKKAWIKTFDFDKKPNQYNTPLILDGKVYGSLHNEVYCLDVKSSGVAWSKKFSTEKGLGEMLFMDNKLMFHDNNQSLYFLSLDKGKKEAVYSLKPETISGHFVYANQTIFFINSKSMLCAMRLL